MNSQSLGVVLINLAIQNLVCIGTLCYLAKRFRSRTVIREIFLFVYWTTIPLSGLAHTFNRARALGFYDMLGSVDAYMSIYDAAVSSALATLAICAVVILAPVARLRTWSRSIQEQTSMAERIGKPSAQAIVGLVLLVPSVLSLWQIKAYAKESGMARVIEISGGNAKYAFMSHWFAWSITLLVLAAIAAIPDSRRSLQLAIAFSGMLAIAWSLSWSGGRSVVVIMTLPLILCLSVSLGRSARYLYFSLGVLTIAVLAKSASARSQGYRNQDAFSILSLLDWQWGRFSMLGFSHSYVQHNGPLLGETIVAGLWSIPVAIFKLVGFNIENGPRLSTQITGEQILGDPQQAYIVPGMPAELYMNFGTIGILVGIPVIAGLVCAAERRFNRSQTMTERLGWSYIATCLIFCVIPAHSASLFNYLIFSGAPLLLLLLLSTTNRSERRKTKVSRMNNRQHQSAPKQPDTQGVTV